MAKFYRVKKDNFLWEAGAILKLHDNHGSQGGYEPINDVWDTTEHSAGEYISRRIIENNPDWFERVYEISLLGKLTYGTKEAAKAAAAGLFKSR